MAAESSDLRQLARDDPEAVRSIAAKADDDLAAWLNRVLREEEERGR